MAPEPLIHGKTIADDRLCPAGRVEFATVFLELVDCPDCLSKLGATPEH